MNSYQGFTIHVINTYSFKSPKDTTVSRQKRIKYIKQKHKPQIHKGLFNWKYIRYHYKPKVK
jgi:hypothetical protein